MDDPTLPNSPAGDFWTIYIVYVFQNSTQTQYIPISYLPTGELDLQHTTDEDIVKVSTLLGPTVELVSSNNRNNSFDMLKFLNFMFVTSYWVNLGAFGQLSPTTYTWTDQGMPNFSQPINFSSRNNIFVNDTLFQIYSSYLHDVIVPLLRSWWPQVTLPPFLPLSERNQLQLAPGRIIRNYTCSERRMKGWVSVVISVLAADYALLGGAYHIFIYIASWFQKRREGESKFLRRQ